MDWRLIVDPVPSGGGMINGGDPNVRHMLKWDAMGANHNRKSKGKLPPAGMLRLYKLVRSGSSSQN